MAGNHLDSNLQRDDSTSVGYKQTAPTPGGTSADVAGPTSSTDNAIARMDGTSGKVIQDGVPQVSDTGDILASSTTQFPVYTFIGDEDTGVGRNGPNQLSLYATFEKVRITSNQFMLVSGGNPSLPKICLTLDSNTGVYWPAADELAVTLGGIKAFGMSSEGVPCIVSATEPTSPYLGNLWFDNTS